jgi:hypothetical protein
VALAHILAFEDPAAEGRYLTASGTYETQSLFLYRSSMQMNTINCQDRLGTNTTVKKG